MDSADQVIFVLQLVLTLGPIAVYFLGLGLVNSQSHPCLINARADFVLLAVAFVPVIIGPVVVLVEHCQLLLASAVVVGVACLFFAMMPGRDAGWVIYNIDPERCRRLLERACRRLGWTVATSGDQLHIAPVNLVVTSSALPWLRNVTIRICSSSASGRFESARDRLIGAMYREIQTESMLPSPTGASLVVIGAGLLGLPMWFLFYHMNAIVDVVRQILFA